MIREKTKIQVYTDGACSGNPGPGGYAFYIPQLYMEGSGGEKETTNNRMELQGVTAGLKYIASLSDEANSPLSITVISDSKYVTDAFNQGWLRNWKRNNWKTASGSAVKNQDLWGVLNSSVDYLIEEGHDVYFVWTKGHAGDPINVLVDHMACEARDKAKEEHEIANL